MSLPFPAPKNESGAAAPRALVCPKCRTHWPETDAPAACPRDGTALVKERDESLDDSDPMVGRTLEGRYTILARLGAGSMGTVYRAKQHAMGREVAIKILRGDRAADEASKARFMREARANSLLASPNTVTVFDFGESDSGEFYLAMELLEGESVGQRLTRLEKLPPALAVDTARQALRSLGEAHAKGIIHRDLKPDNLFYARVLGGSNSDRDEIVKVLDFGIAKMLRDDGGLSLGERGVVETQAGTVFGTPRYMSPEQAQGKPLDARSDLYSLAVILYQMLTGRPPFTDDDAVVVMARHIKSAPKRPNEAHPEANVPKELEDVIMRTLSKDPAGRPANAEAMAAELLAALEAHGALTSGVRASLANAGGVGLPDSMRPPAFSPPQAERRVSPLTVGLAVVAPIVLVVAALGVYFGMRSGHRSTSAASTGVPTATMTAPAGPSSSPSSGPNASAAPASDDAPAMSPHALPTASGAAPPSAASATAPTGSASAATGGTKPAPGGARPGGRRPPAGRPGERPSTTSGTPTPAPTSSYGIFE